MSGAIRVVNVSMDIRCTASKAFFPLFPGIPAIFIADDAGLGTSLTCIMSKSYVPGVDLMFRLSVIVGIAPHRTQFIDAYRIISISIYRYRIISNTIVVPHPSPLKIIIMFLAAPVDTGVGRNRRRKRKYQKSSELL